MAVERSNGERKLLKWRDNSKAMTSVRQKELRAADRGSDAKHIESTGLGS